MDNESMSDQSPAYVLVVDDEGANRYSVSKTLQRVGHIVHDVDTGEKALEMLNNQDYEVVLTDIRMDPGIDGVELLRRIKDRSPDAIVILMTGYASLSSAVEALRLGAHDYLIKPSSSQDIRASVQRGIERARNLKRRRHLLETIKNDVFELAKNETEAILYADDEEVDEDEAFSSSYRVPEVQTTGNTMQVGPLMVYPGRYQVSMDNKPIDLTPTEFDLLLYLAAHRGRVVPCHELVREVRGYTIDETEAREVIRPHVSNLRRKLKNAGKGADVIVNVRGIGYRLSERTD
jgi:DNA-binding response OmpR family regulator